MGDPGAVVAWDPGEDFYADCCGPPYYTTGDQDEDFYRGEGEDYDEFQASFQPYSGDEGDQEG